MKNKPRTLIVYDDEATRTSLMLILNKNGYEIEGVGTGGEALKRVEEGFYNIVLVDGELSDMEGVDLLASLKACHPDMAVSW
jgi:DNA-binding NtrC family response regulator